MLQRPSVREARRRRQARDSRTPATDLCDLNALRDSINQARQAAKPQRQGEGV